MFAAVFRLLRLFFWPIVTTSSWVERLVARAKRAKKQTSRTSLSLFLSFGTTHNQSSPTADFLHVQKIWNAALVQTLPKAQRTRGLSSSYQSNYLRSYHKFKHKSWSNSSSESYQLLSQTSASPIKFKFKILTKPSFRISAKVQLHNLYKHQQQNAKQIPSSKSCRNFNF